MAKEGAAAAASPRNRRALSHSAHATLLLRPITPHAILAPAFPVVLLLFPCNSTPHRQRA